MAKIDASKLNLEETVVQVSRVSKVVKGGRRFSIRALVVWVITMAVSAMGLARRASIQKPYVKA